MTPFTLDDLALLATEEAAALVERHLAEDPAAVALALRGERRTVRLVCQQIKTLQRVRAKLPTWYAARCVLPPLACEQSSGEAAAAEKPWSGALCVDLSCGLGVDSYYFARRFERVIAVERDPATAAVAHHNFERLGVTNVTVENTSAEVFLAGYSGPKADLIYLDPSRRNAGRRVFKLEECSPDVTALLPGLLRWGERVAIKLSPLFDVDEAIRSFGPTLASVEAVSAGGEVKELLVELTGMSETLRLGVRVAGVGHWRFDPQARGERSGGAWEEARYLLIPDAAFYKMGLTEALAARFEAEERVVVPEKNGFAFACRIPEGFPGRAYCIEQCTPWRPKALKKELAARGVGRVNLLRRRFVLPSDGILRALGVAEGGSEWLAFTAIGGENLVFRVTLVQNTDKD